MNFPPNKKVSMLKMVVLYLTILASGIGFYFLTLHRALDKCMFVYGTGERIDFCDPTWLYAGPISYLLFSALVTTSIWLFVDEREGPFRSKLEYFLKSRRVNISGWAIFIFCGGGILIGKSSDPLESMIGNVCLLGAAGTLARVLIRDGYSSWTRFRKR